MFFSASTGVIYTAGILDCETKDSYWLTVYATDRGITPLSASIEVFIQVRSDPNFTEMASCRNLEVSRPVLCLSGYFTYRPSLNL